MKEYGPDSKQSWLVVLASSVVKFMGYGLTEVAGMLMVYTMYRFDTTREAASLPYTLVYTIRNGLGPIIAYIGNIIGLRLTTLIGCVISSIAVGACFFAENVMTVTVLWGIIFGFGFAFEGLLLNSITMEHFNNNLSKALGVTSAGAVLGIFFFSPYLDFLVNRFGLSGAFLLIAGATLHAIPAALFMLLNKPHEQTHLSENRTRHRAGENNQKGMENFVSISHNAASNQNLHNSQENGYINSIYSKKFQTICNDNKFGVKIVAYKANDTDAFEIDQNASIEWNDLPLSSKNDEQIIGSQIDISLNSRNDEQNKDKQVDAVYEKNSSIHSKINSEETRSKISKQPGITPEKPTTNKLMKILFSHPIFWLILICNGMHYFTLPAFFTLLIDYAIDIGIDPIYAKYIVIYSTCAEFVGCLVLGWLADLKLLSCNGFAIIMFLTQSLALAVMPWTQNIIFLALVILVFQWTQNGITLIYPSVVSESLEKYIQPSALASMFMLAAPLDLTISPLIGYFRDEKGSYTGVYLTLSLAAFIGSLSQMCILKCVNKRKRSL